MAAKWNGPISEIKNNLSKIIGKTYKGLTILEVMDSFDGKEVKRISKCQCPCGNIVYENFPDVLYGDYTRKYCCPQKKEALKALKKHFKKHFKRRFKSKRLFLSHQQNFWGFNRS